MRKLRLRIFHDFRNRRHIDAYALAFIAFLLAVLSVVGDIIPDQVRWAALLAGVGILVLRTAIPMSPSVALDEILEDRFAFADKPIVERLKNATEVWVYAPSAVNLLSIQNCEMLRTGCLSKSDGSVRVVVLNPSHETSVKLAIHQLDDSLDYPIQNFAESLQDTIRRMHAMSSWKINGNFEYRLLDYNPGFSLVGINPSRRDGRLIIEFHGFHNESTSSRMHIEISRQDSDHWYEYWADQFGRIWEAATIPQS